jgi:hypothetical protein
MNYLTICKGDNTVTYGNAQYRIQNDRGHIHIVVREGGFRKKITVKRQESDWCFDYVFGGLSVRYPCPAIRYFIHRHRMGNRITAQDYKIKFNVKLKL